MIKYYCDRCGKECHDVFIHVSAYSDNDNVFKMDFYNPILCTDCFEELKNWIKKDE